MSYIKNIAIVGANGRIGSYMVNALLANKKHTITAITRAEGSFAPGVVVKIVDYDSPPSLVEALKGQDALIITQAAMAPAEQQTKLIEAAAEAGVPWILPNEYGSDNAHPDISAVPVNGVKKQYRDKIEALGKSSWIGLINNQWYEYSLGTGSYGIEIQQRTANLYDSGNTKTVSTTMPQVGRAVVSLMSLPISGASPCVSDYKNNFIYIESFFISQNEMLASVQRVTGTSPADWQVSYRPVEQAIQDGYARLKKGDWKGLIDVLYGATFVPGKGGDYSVTKGTANKALGLPKEDLDEATRRGVEESKKPRQW